MSNESAKVRVPSATAELHWPRTSLVDSRPSTKENISFEAWEAIVSARLRLRIGLELDMLEDQPTRDLYDAGHDTRSAAVKIVERYREMWR